MFTLLLQSSTQTEIYMNLRSWHDRSVCFVDDSNDLFYKVRNNDSVKWHEMWIYCMNVMLLFWKKFSLSEIKYKY
jgi:hypothetical protein